MTVEFRADPRDDECLAAIVTKVVPHELVEMVKGKPVKTYHQPRVIQVKILRPDNEVVPRVEDGVRYRHDPDFPKNPGHRWCWDYTALDRQLIERIEALESKPPPVK